MAGRDGNHAFARRLGWVPGTLVVLLPILGTAALALGQEFQDGGDTAWFIGGLVAYALAAGIQGCIGFYRRKKERSQRTEAVRLRVAMKNAFQPVVQLMATMPYQAKRKREATLNEVAARAVGGIGLLLKDVDDVRAVVFTLGDDGKSMSSIVHHGRGTNPRPFEAGTVRGDRALALLRTEDDLFVEDLDKEEPDKWKGTGRGYKTFISARIASGDNGYGMLTVDAPNAGDLVDTDRQIVLLMAHILAVAFAEADRAG